MPDTSKPKSTSPRLLMLITNLGKGGAQRVFYDHARAFARLFPVEEAVFDRGEDDRLYDSGLQLYSLDHEERRPVPGPAGRLLQRARALKKVVDRTGADIVISHMDGANWVNVLSSNKAKKILVVHGTVLYDKDQHPVVQWFRKRMIIPYLYNRASLTVAVSEGIAQELRTACRVRRVIAIPNFFDISQIDRQAALPIPARFEQLFATAPVLVTSGRMADQKKQLVLPGILKEVQQAHPEAKMMILGDGPLRDALLQEAADQGLRVWHTWDTALPYSEDYDIYFPGYVDNPFQYLRRSALFLFPSGWEGFPMALCEAMVAGVPVLSADCPTGPREILSPGTTDITYSLTQAERTPYGVLLPMTDKPGFRTEWVKATNDLLGNEESRRAMAARARQKVEGYDKDTVLAIWQKTIEDLQADA